jgi:hypothetical protein
VRPRAFAVVIEPEMMTTVAVWSAPLVPLRIVKINVESVIAVPGLVALPVDEDEAPNAPLIR